MIFVDTGAWFSLFVPDDADHEAATTFVEATPETLVTTDYVLDETLTLLKVRRAPDVAIEAGRALWAGRVAIIDYCTRRDVASAWAIFEKYRDKDWSFTDCVSFAFMKRRKLSRALSTDRHFDQFPGLRRVGIVRAR